MKNKTTKQVPNPTGKGGFAEHPENRSNGGWKKENTFYYQYKRFLNMSVEEFAEWGKNTDRKDKTVVESIAWTAVNNAKNDQKNRVEVANRTEGMPSQKVEMNTNNDEAIDKLNEIIRKFEPR